jgi:hypothetical protein
MEAYPGAHHWSREFSKFDHTVRMMVSYGVKSVDTYLLTVNRNKAKQHRGPAKN